MYGINTYSYLTINEYNNISVEAKMNEYQII